MTVRRFVILTVKCDAVDFLKTFVVEEPGVVLCEDQRSPDQILADAAGKGLEISYLANFHGVSSGYYDQLRRAGVRRVRRDFEVKSEWDVEVDLHSRVRVVE